jgi:hypothetical protein
MAGIIVWKSTFRSLKNIKVYIAVLPGLLSIVLASLTQLLLKSPNTFMNVRQDVPREILVHDEHTGAKSCSAATAD